jgi:hypothetical protein
MCGIGFRHLYTEQSLLLTCMVIKHLRIEGQAQHLFHISLAWAQLASGVGVPILEFPDYAIPTLEDPFFQGIHAGGMTRLSASICLLDNFVRPLSRTGDFYLIDGLNACGLFSDSESLRVNYFRLYLGVYLASDVVSPNGKTLLPGMFRGSTVQRLNRPSVLFPCQARPDATSWTQWRRALRALFTVPRCTQLVLLEPLGNWFPLRSDSQKWMYYRTSDTIIVRSRQTDKLCQYTADTSGLRRQHFSKSRVQVILSLPPNCVPVAKPTESRVSLSISHLSGQNFEPPLPAPSAPISNNSSSAFKVTIAWCCAKS